MCGETLFDVTRALKDCVNPQKMKLSESSHAMTDALAAGAERWRDVDRCAALLVMRTTQSAAPDRTRLDFQHGAIAFESGGGHQAITEMDRNGRLAYEPATVLIRVEIPNRRRILARQNGFQFSASSGSEHLY